MKIEDKLTKFKQNYQNIPIPDYLEKHGWENIALKLDAKQKSSLFLAFPKQILFASLLLLVFGCVIASAQYAKPEEPLYQVKVLAENFMKTITGKPQMKKIEEKPVTKIIPSTKENKKEKQTPSIETKETITPKIATKSTEKQKTQKPKNESQQQTITIPEKIKNKVQEVLHSSTNNNAEKNNKETHRQNEQNQNGNNSEKETKINNSHKQ